MGKSKENLEDLPFVLEGIRWYRSQEIRALMKHFQEHRMDMLLHFVHPTRGTFWVGREGSVRTRAAARRFLSGQGEHRRKTSADRIGDCIPRLLIERIAIPKPGANTEPVRFDSPTSVQAVSGEIRIL